MARLRLRRTSGMTLTELAETLMRFDCGEGINLDGGGSTTLWVDRVQRFVPDFALTPANQGHVADVVRALDGIPLAIELAAARAKLDDRRRSLEQQATEMEQE